MYILISSLPVKYSCNEGCSTGSIINPSITCDKCAAVYCFVHNNAHLNKTCDEYMKGLSERVRKDLQDSENLIKFGTKGCPQCKSPHEKNGGCNHMTCGHCRCDWCWICNANITDKVHDHYSDLFASCRGMQFTDMRSVCVHYNVYIYIFIYYVF